jgi:Uma2 family endonuclease
VGETTTPERYRFTVDEYHRLGEAGILGEDDRVELIDGEIVMMTPIGSRHAACVDQLTRSLVELYGDAGVVRVQNPITLDVRSEPQPDVVVLRPIASRYFDRHPQPADVLLAIEVADSSLGYDRRIKIPLYASAGIAELSIVDLGRELVDVHREPFPGGYAERRTYRRGERIPLPGVDAALEVDAILP